MSETLGHQEYTEEQTIRALENINNLGSDSEGYWDNEIAEGRVANAFLKDQMDVKKDFAATAVVKNHGLSKVGMNLRKLRNQVDIASQDVMYKQYAEGDRSSIPANETYIYATVDWLKQELDNIDKESMGKGKDYGSFVEFQKRKVSKLKEKREASAGN